MANTILRSNYQDNAFHVLGLLFLMLVMMQKSSATQFRVGGNSKEWTVPDNSTNANSYNQWAENNRFQIGDSLLFAYKADQDSVFLVNQDKYANCDTTEPISKYNDGHTVFTFNHSGPYYFISGNKENCLKNEKLIVVVMADRSNYSSNTNQTSTASPPSPSTMDIAPSPAPASEESPPAGTVEINPTPAPTGESPNAASSVLMSFTGSFIGAFFASSLILVY